MTRSLPIALGLSVVLALGGCGGDSCESVQGQIEDIGREIQQDPPKALEESTVKKLKELGDKLEDMGCLG